ncbi:hypothetical protein [Streptomyces sp. NBC_01477]|uniref:hypothetical protein n=1 Tax=Streptomyces sp. NBC_01477 TaxID=2976015 RepID=UPI002E331F63|nr:hypothetical protein [Streptomyces sp. NBC_01477]
MADVQLTVGAAPAVDAERVDRLTGQLRGDLREATGLLVRRAYAAEVPDGAMAGTALQLGTLVVSGVFSAATVKGVVDVILRRLERSAVTQATVSWQVGGRTGTVTASGTGVPADQLVALAAAWANADAGAGAADSAAPEQDTGGGDTAGGSADRTAGRD